MVSASSYPVGSRGRRRPVAAVGVIAAMFVVVLAVGASVARAAGSCSASGGTTTCTFGSTGSQDTFVVPAGVTSIQVVATGAPGAVGGLGRAAGRGAQVTGDVAVSPGQTLYVNVGGAPTPGGQCAEVVDIACNGGFNGGGSSGFAGGGGGGGSDVRTVSSGQPGSLSSRLIVAAGGGGSGLGALASCNTSPGSGGPGGDAGSNGGPGKQCGSIPASAGGAAGTASAGGSGGSPGGQGGLLGQGGGAGGSGSGGGGGGGGLFGGGGGATEPATTTFTPGGGGGGGSNLVPGGGTAAVSDSGPSVTISYQGEGCWTNAAGAGATTCRFWSTGAQETFMPPAGVSSIHVVATGAPGAVGTLGGTVGRGAQVSADVTVTPGQTLYVNVGGPGAGPAGGFNGGGTSSAGPYNSGGGGGGGGATDLRTVSSTQPGSLPSRLIVAAGGGGTGYGEELGACASEIVTTGGDGGDAGSDGGQGGPGVITNYGQCSVEDWGGGAGTQTAGGQGGYAASGWPTVSGDAGSMGQGGDGGVYNPVGAGSGGGGGGGGLYGGGGGSSGDEAGNNTTGGGGGGSNLVPAGGSTVITNSRPSMLITYQAIGLTPPLVPKLHLAIAGPRGVKRGHTAAYRITLGHTQPHTGRRYTVTNVHVGSRHAGHRVGHWLVRKLPPGRARTLRLKLHVPSTAHGSFCITTRAAARHTRGAAVRHCTAIKTTPPQGRG